MKLIERGDEHINMGDLDTNQDRYVEDSGIGDINPDDINSNDVNPDQQLGSLGFILGSLIAGTSNSQSAIEMVQSSPILGKGIKELINKVIDDEKSRLDRGREQWSSKPVDDDLQESIEKIKKNFKRFL